MAISVIFCLRKMSLSIRILELNPESKIRNHTSIKKLTLDPKNNNCRHISNLSFLSKMTEGIVALYHAPLEDVIKAHGMTAMMYADNSQLYGVLKRSNSSVYFEQLELCVDDVIHWKTQNGLKFKPKKTKVIQFYYRFIPSDRITHFRVVTAITQPKMEVKGLGVTFEANLTLHTYINKICRSGSLSLQ